MYENKHNRTPIIDPLLLMLKSRRVLVALISLLLSVVVLAFPTLEAVQHELLILIVTLALSLIGGYSVEDAAIAARQEAPPDEWRTELREAINMLLDEALPQDPMPNK